ncbi:MAG: hypothetical protein M0P71_16530 [Melioribacteraceae bacterium]|jgi:hypothetical protein|nr:hypothetical protein [Melioribacteraceae bacterium]
MKTHTPKIIAGLLIATIVAFFFIPVIMTIICGTGVIIMGICIIGSQTWVEEIDGSMKPVDKKFVGGMKKK